MDLASTASSSSRSPPIVDLSQSEPPEIRELFQTLVNMFPDTQTEYLEEQAEELAGRDDFELVKTHLNLSGLVQTYPDLSELVRTCLSELVWTCWNL